MRAAIRRPAHKEIRFPTLLVHGRSGESGGKAVA